MDQVMRSERADISGHLIHADGVLGIDNQCCNHQRSDTSAGFERSIFSVVCN
jgi:hypothetical protein